MNPNRPEPIDEWEGELDRALQRLPDRPAPSTLIPRVLAALEARACRPWYRREWSTWPRPFQGLSLAVLSFLLGALTYACLHFPELAAPDTMESRWNTWVAPWVALWNAGQAMLEVLTGLCQNGGGWFCVGLGVAVLLLYLSTLGAGTMLYRMAWNQRGGKR